MNEFEIIKRYFQEPFKKRIHDDVVLGSGDDAAILRVPDGFESVHSHDAYIEGHHFPVNYAPQHLASRTVLASASDLVAMGAKPLALTMSLSLPEINESWLANFSQGLQAVLKHLQMDLIGGDLIKGPLMLSLHVIGQVAQNQSLQRNGAKVGDTIWVTGCCGGAAAALKTAFKEPQWMPYYDQPSLPVSFSQLAREHIHAAIDVSDGLLADIRHVLQKSHVAATIDIHQVPLAPSLENYFSKDECIKLALTGGDDYQLLFTAAQNKQETLLLLAEESQTTITAIGQVTQGNGDFLLEPNISLNELGYKHFR